MRITLSDLDRDPHPVLARLREESPVCWVPELGGWLVTGYDAAVGVLLDPAAFTVDDPRFTTARVTGPSMLSLDGAAHARHRAPFARAFRPAQAAGEDGAAGPLAEFTRAESARLAGAIRPAGQADLRASVAGPLAAAVMTEALGLASAGVTPAAVLAWYRDIVAAVAALPASAPAGRAAGMPVPGGEQPTVPVASFGALAAALREVIAAGGGGLLAEAAGDGTLTGDEIVSNAAVALFGGIETTEGMICNALLHLLAHPELASAAARDPGLVPAAVEESLRLEPAAAVVDRYAARDVALGSAAIRRGDLVRVSIAGANRDPAAFAAPGRYDPGRPGAARHLAFARGPHFCIGASLARLEAVTAVRAALTGLPGLHLDPDHPAEVRGLVFRKPCTLRALWRP